MSDTTVDMDKVHKMLSAGWDVNLFKTPIGHFGCLAQNPREIHYLKARDRFLKNNPEELKNFKLFCFTSHGVTIEEALTKLASKVVDGKII